MTSRESMVVAQDGVELRCRCSDPVAGRPWLLFSSAFGLRVEAADALFDFFAGEYNIVTWESRLILSTQDRPVAKEDFSLSKHVQDLFSVAAAFGVSNPTLIGYCSGAGIALAAIRERPDYFRRLVLVHGEFTLLKDPSCVTQILKDIDSILPIASRGQDKAQFILERVASLKGDRSANVPSHIDLNLPFGNSRSLHCHALSYMAYRENDFEKLATSIPVPTLVMAGNADMHTNVPSALRIGNAIGHAEMFVDTNADHYGVIRPGSKVLHEIERFLRAG